MLLGAPSAGDGACGTLAEALHEREQVVVEVTVVKQPRTVRQPHVQPHGKRAAKPLIVRAKQLVGHSEVLGKPRLAGSSALFQLASLGATGSRNGRLRGIANAASAGQRSGPGAGTARDAAPVLASALLTVAGGVPARAGKRLPGTM